MKKLGKLIINPEKVDNPIQTLPPIPMKCCQ